MISSVFVCHINHHPKSIVLASSLQQLFVIKSLSRDLWDTIIFRQFLKQLPSNYNVQDEIVCTVMFHLTQNLRFDRQSTKNNLQTWNLIMSFTNDTVNEMLPQK